MDLEFYIENCIIPQYALFDEAHNVEHVSRVIEVSLLLAEEYGVNPIMCYTIAAYHDIGLPQGRETHHLTSAQIMREDKALRNWCSEETIRIMAEAIEDHRASAENPPRSIYGAIVAEADRVIDTETIILRTLQFGQKHYPDLSYDEHIQRAVNHLKEKYGRGGYLKLWIPWSDNAVRLQELQDLIADESALVPVVRKRQAGLHLNL
jgi:uncharacterized protein